MAITFPKVTAENLRIYDDDALDALCDAASKKQDCKKLCEECAFDSQANFLEAIKEKGV